MVELPPTNRNGIRGPLLRFHRGCEIKMLSLWIGLTTIFFLWNLKESFAFNKPVDLDYCSHDVSTRKIHPLADSLKDFDPSLSIDDDVDMLQIQVLVRHGARTPVTCNCWENYNYTWDCSSTFLVHPSDKMNVFSNEPIDLFRIKYGDGGLGTDTILNGTCKWGQLIHEGYDQMRQNGEILRHAYVYEGGGCLLKSNKVEDMENKYDDLWLASDDMFRTVMSGQVLTKTLFDTTGGSGRGVNILEWHTGGDAKIDHMFDYHGGCPRAEELIDEWRNSKRYKAKISSEDTKILKDKVIKEWRVNKEVWEKDPADVVWNHYFDCIMSTVCTGRELPHATGPDTASEIVDLATWLSVDRLFYLSGQIVKVNFAPLFTRIRNFASMLSPEHGQSDRVPKFALFSTHDTSLMAFLSVLAPEEWDRKWTPYASMVVIEVMRISGNIYFRAIYNGKVLKPALCKKDICPISVLESITSFVADPEVS